MDRSRIGLMVNGQFPLSRRIWAARAAEAAGLHSVWTSDGAGDSLVTLTAFALHTSRIRIGTGVLVWNRPAPIAAIAAAQIQQESGGRLILGLGAGPKEWNERWWDIPFDRPVARMREYVRALQGIWASDPNLPYSFAGEQIWIDGLVRAFQRTGASTATPPPIWLGATGPQMSALAGKVAHGVLLNPTLSRRHLEEVAIPAVLAGAEGRREEVTLAALVTCAPDDDDERALRAAASGIVAQLGRGYFMDSWRLDGFGDAIDEAAARAAAGDTAGAFAEIPPDLVRLVAAAGTPEACARRIEELLRVLDVVVLVPPTFMADEAEWARRAESVLALASAAG